MKKIFFIVCSILLVSCNDQNANNCFQTAGDIIQQEVEVATFEKVVVHARIELIITQGDEQKVLIETGENLLNDITAEVINNELILKNNNTCNFVRAYDLTKVYITVPNLTKIRNASEKNIYSNGLLTYNSLELVSIGDEDVYLPIGDWHLNIQNENIRISSNGNAIFYLEGTTTNLNINLFDFCDSRFEGEHLIAQHIKINQISSNDMLIYPVESLSGAIYATGDVISFNKPTTVNVDDLSDYAELIFK
ncbi:head GIN domain-containing protein [Lutibacter holmesii]|uniref:Head GIN domain-containing protein n=1 Tax=Lutibacter holmesii TaxID=1137985 RepID=A0ABW3WMA0_9FLAO